MPAASSFGHFGHSNIFEDTTNENDKNDVENNKDGKNGKNKKIKDKLKKNAKKIGLVAMTAVICVSGVSLVSRYLGDSINSNEVSDSTPLAQAVEASKKTKLSKKEQKLVKEARENFNKDLNTFGIAYLARNIDEKYAKVEKMQLANMLYVGNTLADGDKVSKDETIDSLMNKPDEEWSQAFITQIDSEVALYDVDDNSDYLVGFADTMKDNTSVHVNDYCFANNNNNGEKLDGCYYDKDTGIAYIPKKIFINDKNENILEQVRLQLLQVCTIPVGDMAGTYHNTTKETDTYVMTTKMQGEVFNSIPVITTEKGLDKSEILLAVNGLPIAEDKYEYDKKTGQITISSTPTALYNVTVDIDKKDTITKIKEKLSDFITTSDVDAASPPVNDGLGNAIKSAGTITLPSGAKEGSVYRPSMDLKYDDSKNFSSSSYYRGYAFMNNGQGGKDVWDWIVNTGGNLSTNLKTLTVANNDIRPINSSEDVFHAINLNSLPSSYAYVNKSGTNGWATMRCCHYASPIKDNENTGTTSGNWEVYMRILNLDSHSVMVGFASRRICNQTGCCFVKFNINGAGHTLTYNLRGGGIGTDESLTPFITADSNYNIISQKPTRAGYTFKHWYGGTSQNVGTVYHTDNSAIPRVYIRQHAEDVWEVMAYAPNASKVQAPNWTENPGDLVWSTLGSGSWSREGYTFNFGAQISIRNDRISNYDMHIYAWNSAGAQLGAVAIGGHYGTIGAIFSPGSNYKYRPNKNQDIYAVWQANKYTVSYNSNGGSGSMASDTVTFDSNYTVKNNAFTRAGYTFQGWNTKADGTGTDMTSKIGSSQKWTIAGDTTLYAIWKKNTHTNYVAHWLWGFQNGEGTNVNKQAYYLKTTSFEKAAGANTTYTEPDSSIIPNGTYFSKEMASPDISGTGEWTVYNVPYSLTQPEHGIYTEYAYWLYYYNITYNLNGGTNNANNPTTYNVLYGVSLKNPTRPGYVFDGWYNGNTKVTGINEGKNATFSSADDLYNQLASRTTGDISLTARWTPIKYTFVFNGLAPNTTTNKVSGSMANQVIDYDSRVNLNKNTYTLPNHKFIGWSTSSGNNLNKDNITYKDGDSIYNLTTVNGTVYNLYTVWDEMPKISTKYRKYLKDKDVSLEELIKYVKASDKEDGDLTKDIKIKQIQYSDRTDTSPTELDTSVVEDNILVTVSVTDSIGSTVEEVFAVTIYEEKPEIIAPSDKEKIRFVGNYESKRYYLKADSNWATDRILNQKLKDSFASTNTGQRYVYDAETKRWKLTSKSKK